jgi:thiol-disulfide isomerase/thioredoxin
MGSSLPRFSRRLVLPLIFLLSATTPGFQAAVQDRPLEPRIASGEVFLEALNGAALTEADLARDDVLAVFWASWSPRCRDLEGQIHSLRERWGKRARIIAINFQEDESTIRRFLGPDADLLPIYLDLSGAFARDHGVTTLPALVIFHHGEGLYQGRLTDDTDRRIARVLTP